MVLSFAVLAFAQFLAPGGAVHGTVRGAEDGRALSGARVEANQARTAPTDAGGRYSITGLPAGFQHLRFSMAGYEPREVAVLVADSADVELDVDLVPLPVVLPQIQVVAQSETSDRAPPPPVAEPEIGHYRFGAEWQASRLAGQVDIQSAIADLPGVQSRGDDAADVHIRGGGSSENLVLLDGIPLFSAAHFAGSSSAVNPDALSHFDVHSGVSSSSFGGRLAGVIELETTELGSDALQATGALGPGDVRQLVRGPLPGVGGGFLLAGRSSFRNLLDGGTLADTRNGFSDVLGVVTARLGSGSLRLISFRSGNQLGFANGLDSLSAGLAGQSAGLSNQADGRPVGANNLEWRSHSDGISWSRSPWNGALLQTLGWWAGSSADIDWLGPGGAVHLHSSLDELGVSQRLLWPVRGGTSSVGFSLVRPSTRYEVTQPSAVTPAAVSPLLSLHQAPVVASLFAERHWRPAAGVSVFAGLRANTDFGGWWSLEPRVTTVLELDPVTRLGFGFGRTHQVVQSFLNEESVLGARLGFELPVATGSRGFPIARADQIEVLAERRFARSLDVSISGYVRHLSNLALPPASTLGLFATDSISFGSGTAAGVTGTVAFTRGPVLARASLALSRSVRWNGQTRYDAGFNRGATFGVDAVYQVRPRTTLQLRFRTGAGQPTSVVAPGFDWEPYQPLSGSGGLAGTPENLPGPINGARLPGYTRLDLGVRRSWRLSGIRRNGVLTTAISVYNLLNRQNPLGLVAQPGASWQAITGSPRGVTFELGWTF